METIKISCELVVRVDDENNMPELLKSIRENSIKCFGVWASDYGYEIQKFQKLKVLK